MVLRLLGVTYTFFVGVLYKGKVQFDYFASVNKGQLVEDTYLSQLPDIESTVCLSALGLEMTV